MEHSGHSPRAQERPLPATVPGTEFPLTAHAPLDREIFPECGGQKAVGARTSVEPEPDPADPGLGPCARFTWRVPGSLGSSRSCPESPFSSRPSNPYDDSFADVRGRLARAE